VAEHLHEVEQTTGKLIHLDLEPEPGCVLERAEDVLAFFAAHLGDRSQRFDVSRYLRVCHDVCHAAVMYDDQAEVLAAYDQAGIRVGKVQLSSAVRVDFDALVEADRAEAWRQLSAFREPRYLHQTVIRREGADTFHDDLPAALEAHTSAPRGEWRVHFHVPIFLEGLGLLDTTQSELVRALSLFMERTDVNHFEVETYAWEVLPPETRAADLADGIARELRWVQEQLPMVAACR
jgi:hypothetical protein